MRACRRGSECMVNAIFHILPLQRRCDFRCTSRVVLQLYRTPQRDASTTQALHPVSRTWLRGGSPHRILKKLPVWAATLLRGCAGRRQSQPHLAPRPGGLERAIHASVHSCPPLAQMRLRHAMRGRPCSCARSQLGPSRRVPRQGVLWPTAGCQLSQSALGCVMSHTPAQVASCRTRRRVCAYPCQPLARSRASGLSIGRHGAHRVLVS